MAILAERVVSEKGDETMNAEPAVGGHTMSGPELEKLRGSRVFLMIMGVSLIALGAVAMGSSFIATLATVLMFGLVLLLGAIFQVVTAFWARQWRGFFLHMIAGVLYLIASVFMLQNPLEAALGLTILVAVCLLVGGIMRIVMSVFERFEGWGWVFVNGLVSVLLGAAIWRQWPLSGFWVIGLFVGIEMFLSGLSWLMLAMALRSIPRPV
jgi:uncharacterized membrane protein HdeD (DUF308 family)